MARLRSTRRFRKYIIWLAATAATIVIACFALNCAIDPIWYLRGNIVTDINYPFNERLAKMVRFLPRMHDYDCMIFGTSRSTTLPEDKAEGYRCFNMGLSDGQVAEYLAYAEYLRQRGFAPRLIIVDIRREELTSSVEAPDIPDFVSSGASPPSIFATYLTLDALDFSYRTLDGDAPHHRFYDRDFHAQLEVRSKRHYYNPPVPIEPAAAPVLHPERAALYVQLRQKFPTARAIAYLPPESAWRVAAFSLSPGFDDYLRMIGTIAAGYDAFLDFALPSPLTESKAPANTYDGSHYSREANVKVLADLLANKSDTALDWRKSDAATITATYHERIAAFITKTAQAETKPAK